MKRLILLFFSVVLLTSCEEEKPKDYSIISGKIDNYKKRSVELVGFNFNKKIRLDKKTKTFADSLKLKTGYYQLFDGKRTIDLYITELEDLAINYNAKAKNVNPTFQGTNANNNKYLQEKVGKTRELLGSPQELYILNEKDFISRLKNFKRDLTKFALNSQLENDFLKKELRNLKYSYLFYLNNYEEYHSFLTKNRKYKLPEDFPSAYKNFEFNNREDYLNSNDYRTLLDKKIEELAKKKVNDNYDYDLAYLETIHGEVSDSLMKNDLIFNATKYRITYTRDLHNYYNKFIQYSTNEKHKKEITEMYDKLKALARGEESPRFFNYENAQGGTTSLDDLLGKDKYILIDIWATWCGFCKREIPLLKKLEKDFHDKENIEFVSISVDVPEKHEVWKKTIAEKEMGGIQLIADKNFSSDFMKKYLVKGLPKFILIDPQGKIVSSNAPKPSNGNKLIKLLEEVGVK